VKNNSLFVGILQNNVVLLSELLFGLFLAVPITAKIA
jgi:hypothetical protein